MEALLNLGKPSNSLCGLQAFYDSVEKHMRALSSLGKSSDSYGSLLTSSILAKLPIETKKHMAREHCNLEWTMNDVMASMLKEIQVLEMSQCVGKLTTPCLPLAPFMQTQSEQHAVTTPMMNIRNGNQFVCIVRVITNPLGVPRLLIPRKGWQLYEERICVLTV